MRAETERDALDADLDHPAQRIALLRGFANPQFDFGILVGVEGIQLARVAQDTLLLKRAGLGTNRNRADLNHVAEDGDAEGAEQLLGQRAGGNPHGGLAGAGPLQHAADGTEVFDGTTQVPVSRPGTRQFFHLLDLVVPVGHHERDRAADRMAAPRAAEDFDVVGFQLLPAAPTISPLTTMQLGVDRLRAEFHAGGKAVDQGHQGFAMRFAGGVVAQHACQFYPNSRGGDRPTWEKC